MSGLRRILKSALEDRSPRYMLTTIALAVVVALLAGAAIGYKVEKTRRAPVKAAAGSKRNTTTTKPKPTLALKVAPLLVGAVFAPGAKQLVVVDAGRKVYRIGLGKKTRVAEASAAKASSIVVGSKVVFQASSSSATTATEVVVLPAKALIGTPVTAVTPGTSMTLKSLQGSGKVIKTTGAIVLTTGPGSSRRIAKKDKVLVGYYIVGKRHPASEIVVLPASSKFN